MTTEQRRARIEATVSRLAGEPVSLTIRDEKSFTFSTETVSQTLGPKVTEFFGDNATTETVHDDEVGTFVYVDVR